MIEATSPSPLNPSAVHTLLPTFGIRHVSSSHRAYQQPTSGRPPSRRAGQSFSPHRSTPSPPARSCRAAWRECARSAPRTAGARAGRRRWSAHRGSTGPGRESARNTSPVSASCLRRAHRPDGPESPRSPWPRGALKFASFAPSARARTSGRRSPRSRTPRGSNKDCGPNPAACRQCANIPWHGVQPPPCCRRVLRPFRFESGERPRSRRAGSISPPHPAQ